jgi:hypothetical protein
LSKPFIVGLYLRSVSKQLEIKSKIKPSSFFLANTDALANDYINFSLVSSLVFAYPGNLGTLFISSCIPVSDSILN